MRPEYLDHYSRLDSVIHRLPAAVKLASAMGLVIGLVLTQNGQWPLFAAAAVFLAGVAFLSRIPLRFIVLRLLWLEPFVLTIALLAIFQPDGVRIFAILLIKSTLCLLTMILLSNTTPFSELLRVLRAVRVPALLLTTLALMYRYVFVLLDESQRMRRARQSRTFTASRWHLWKSTATVLGQLFIRASERAERVYSAMWARGCK
ncbi:MAG TPA: cobalt ECF transporter T component CbiQ [Tepidisphaeraceae bacterium]|nr:cobalt ECF transporter T component CbiQ [Tepidisphaeraceae bacterium]